MLAMVVRPKWVGLCPAEEEEKQKVKRTQCSVHVHIALIGCGLWSLLFHLPDPQVPTALNFLPLMLLCHPAEGELLLTWGLLREGVFFPSFPEAQCLPKGLEACMALLSNPVTREAPTQEVPREVDRQDDSHGEHANQHQQDQEVPLEGEVGGGIDPTLALNLLIPGERQVGVSAGGSSPPPPVMGTLACSSFPQPTPTHDTLTVAQRI